MMTQPLQWHSLSKEPHGPCHPHAVTSTHQHTPQKKHLESIQNAALESGTMVMHTCDSGTLVTGRTDLCDFSGQPDLHKDFWASQEYTVRQGYIVKPHLFKINKHCFYILKDKTRKTPDLSVDRIMGYKLNSQTQHGTMDRDVNGLLYPRCVALGLASHGS